MMLTAWHADRANEKNWHVAVPYLIGGVALTLFTPMYKASFIAGFVTLVVALTFANAAMGVINARVVGKLLMAGPIQHIHAATSSSFVHLCCICRQHSKGTLVPVLCTSTLLLQLLRDRLSTPYLLYVPPTLPKHLPVLTLCCCCCCCLQSSPANLLFTRFCPAQPTAALDTKHTGIGLALYTAILACLGGFSGPVIIGTMVQRLGSFSQATIAMGAILCAAGLLMAGLAVWEKWGRKEKCGSSAALGDSAVESRSQAAAGADKGVASV
jgi:hypothetical protein